MKWFVGATILVMLSCGVHAGARLDPKSDDEAKPAFEFRRINVPETPFSLEVIGKEDESMDLVDDRRIGDAMIEGLWTYEHDRVALTTIRFKLDMDVSNPDAIFDQMRSFVLEVSGNGYDDIQDYKRTATPQISGLPTMRMTYFIGREKGERDYLRFVAVRKDRDMFAFWATTPEDDQEALEAIKRMENSIKVKR